MHLLFNKKTLKESTENVCAAFGVKNADCQDELNKV
jgi:hypothetical protein